MIGPSIHAVIVVAKAHQRDTNPGVTDQDREFIVRDR